MADDLRALEVRYFAAAADAAGCVKEVLEVPESATVADVTRVLSARHGAGMDRVLKVAAYLVGDDLTRDESYPVGARIDVLPPFAGG
ncbi:MoaD/ThiS family protein [Antrihabitans sp. YC2-6]|uniref:MoaD/ThiS family protein n=1 Tax=Antrihabitans sp. YC2-6 TaxID=2799498 RepID=UPI0027DDD40D|nr:MoaD/ThiS family protein [Antrihabitans sp. YC2-6]